MELGHLMSELNKILDQIKKEKEDIQSYYEIQERTLKTGIKGFQVQSFPMLVDGKKQNILDLEKRKIKQERSIELKRLELAELKGQLKVMENLKQKDYDENKRQMNKEIDQKVEEQTQNWLRFNEKKA
jgi:flagellar protein FliJ